MPSNFVSHKVVGDVRVYMILSKSDGGLFMEQPQERCAAAHTKHFAPVRRQETSHFF